ncbi:hypothetical protein NliqN6_2897 [Naganishia liquefaciens]|uniref:Uncharacterized protein n=1 Tax=Naganishia liquefaciens TaxID=104408 RepID=A0A8H3TSN8_9TREE|nr:hypothetical protein NliqN6_2897 [Naganishia liquefaciens]
MPKAEPSRMTRTRAAAGEVRSHPCKGANGESCMNVPSLTSTKDWTTKVDPLFYEFPRCDVVCCSADSKTLGSHSEEGSSSLSRKWSTDHWFWLLLSAIPCHMPGILPFIETFNASHSGKSTPTHGTWKDTFFDLVLLACEVFLPYRPYGGRGSSNRIYVFGQYRSRNETIAHILNLAVGNPDAPDQFQNKIVSSKIQTVIKTLFTSYNNAKLPQSVRHEAGMALTHLAQGYRLEDFYDSHFCNCDSNGPFEKPCKTLPRHRSNVLIADESLKAAPLVEAPEHEFSDAVVLHPFLAFLISRNRFHIDDASLSTFFDCSEPVDHLFGLSPARVWWERVVKADANLHVRFARNWWSNELGPADDCYRSRKVILDTFAQEFANRRRAISKQIAIDLGIQPLE